MSGGGFKRDILISIKYGAMLSTVCVVLLIVFGFLFGGFSIEQAVSILRSGMCIISGLSLFVIAGAILTKRSAMIKEESKWRQKFEKLTYVGVLGIIVAFFILWAAIADALLFIITK